MYIHWFHFLGGHFGTSTDLNSMISPLPLGTFTLECKDTRELYCSIIFFAAKEQKQLKCQTDYINYDTTVHLDPSRPAPS